MSPQAMVMEFHNKYKLPINFRDKELIYLDMDDTPEMDHRIDRITEEYNEVIEAMNLLHDALNEFPTNWKGVAKHHEHVLKELADLTYVCIGTAVTNGYNFDSAFKKVHESNMTKTGDVQSGKLLKGVGYRPPELSDDIYIYAK